MEILITLAIFALVVWGVFFILGMIPLPATPKMIIQVIFAVIFVIALFDIVTGGNHIGLFSNGRNTAFIS